jgi:hypothetical protein
MQISCFQCGYESPSNARYCRQCGSTLVTETESSGASTRNYGRQEPAVPVSAVGSGRLPPSIADATVGETERYFRPPYMAPMGSGIPNTAPIKSKSKLVKLGFFLFLLMAVLFVGALIGAGVTGGLDDPRREDHGFNASDEAEHRRAEAEQRRQEAQERLNEMEQRAREAAQRQQEALERMKEAAERAAEAGLTAAHSNEKLTDLKPYEYPNATIGSAIRIPGNEILTQRTSDPIETVIEYFQKKLGDPIIRITDADEKRVIFQSSTFPSIAVSIETDDEHPNQLKILTVRAPNQLPRPEKE